MLLGVSQKLRKEFRSFSIIWLQQVGHCMNEIPVIEFESFWENIALGDTALKLSQPKLLKLQRCGGGKKDFSKNIFIVEARKSCLSQS